jgi:hypothetical protein
VPPRAFIPRLPPLTSRVRLGPAPSASTSPRPSPQCPVEKKTGVSLPFSSPNPAADNTLPDLRRPPPSVSSGGRQHPPRSASPSLRMVQPSPRSPVTAKKLISPSSPEKAAVWDHRRLRPEFLCRLSRSEPGMEPLILHVMLILS